MENKISCIIVDDEPMALSLLEDYVSKIPLLQLKAKCENAFQALEWLEKESIDLVISDIQMPELNGIELSKMIKKNTRIIFTTAFDQYAIDGFKVEALDYLLKPFDFQEFYTAILKAKEWFSLVRKSVPDAHHDTNESQTIFVKSGYKQVRISLENVLYFEGLKDYIKIWLKDEKPILTLMSLKHLEEILPEKQFMRVHRSFIVALNQINEIERSQIIIGKERITVSDQYKEKFQQFLADKSMG